MFQPRVNVLFVSQRNSLRSLLAQACLNHLGRERFLAHSCGSAVPADCQPHPLVAPSLRAAGIPAENLASRSWSQYARGDRTPMRFVITLSDDVASRQPPVWPGQPDTALWTFPDLLDPARSRAVSPQEAMAMLHTLRRRIELLVSLPMRGAASGDLRSDLRDLAYVR
jgi:arsenate reductase (thioredoxin)